MATVISDDQAKKNIAANIRRLLAARGWTQTDLSEAAHENKMTISNVCTGKHVPGAGLLARIAEALDVSIDRLVDSPPEKSKTSA